MKWTVVRTFGEVRYFNISYAVLLLVPIIAELHLKAASASSIFEKNVAFPPTLKWLYVASLCYAIAIALYQYFCPDIIKQFATANRYVESSMEMYLRAHPKLRLNIVMARLDPQIDAETIDRLQSLLESEGEAIGDRRIAIQREVDSIVEREHPNAVQRFLMGDFHKKDGESPVALWFSFLLYAAGTSVLLVLLIQRSVSVLSV